MMRKGLILSILLLAVGVLWGFGRTLPASYAATTFTINSTNDLPDAAPGDGQCKNANGFCSLRAAVEESNALAGDDTIQIPAGLYKLDLGELSIEDKVTILGAGIELVTIDALLGSRVIVIAAEAEDVLLNNLTLGRGDTDGNGGGILHNGGRLTLSKVNVRQSTAMFGGAIYHNGDSLHLNTTTLEDNRASVNGSGIFATAPLSVEMSTIRNNTFVSSRTGNRGSSGDAATSISQGVSVAAIHNSESTTIEQTLFDSNDIYGFVQSAGNATVQNSTFLNHSEYAFLFTNSAQVAISSTTVMSNPIGILCFNCHLTVHNSEFAYHTTTSLEVRTGTAHIFDSNFHDNHTNTTGGILNETNGKVAVHNSHFTNNVTSIDFSAGAIVNQGMMTLTNVTVDRNHNLLALISGRSGGGIFNSSDGKMHIRQSSIPAVEFVVLDTAQSHRLHLLIGVCMMLVTGFMIRPIVFGRNRSNRLKTFAIRLEIRYKIGILSTQKRSKSHGEIDRHPGYRC